MAKAAKKIHPVEERDNARIAEAVEFTATVRFDGQNYTVRDTAFPAIALKAQAIENTMNAAGGHYAGKRALVYAITASGSSAMVPRDRWAVPS